MPHPVFVVKKNHDGQFFFQMTAKSGQVLMCSEPFMSRYGCEQAIAFVRAAAAAAEMVDCTESADRDCLQDPALMRIQEEQVDTWIA